MQTRTWGVLLALLLAAHFGGCGSKNLTGAGGSAATGSGIGGDGVGGTAGGTGSGQGGVGGIAGGAGCPYGLAGMNGAGGTTAAPACATTFTCGVDGARCLLGEDVCLSEGNASAGGVSGNTSSSSCTSLPPACKGLPTCECVCPGGHCSFGPNCTCTMGVPGPGAVGISCDTGGNHAGGRGGAGGIGGIGGTAGGGRGGGGIAGGAGCPYGLAGTTGTGGLPGGFGGIGGTNPICQPAPLCGDRSCVLGQEYCRSFSGGAGTGGPGGHGGAPPLPPSPMCVALPPECAGDPSCACLCPLGNGRCLNQFCTCQELSQLAISCGGE